MTWPELDALFRANQTYLITSHRSLDGDSVGSQVSLAWYLRQLGKSVVLYNADPVPEKFRFLQGASDIVNVQHPGFFDVLIVLDCSNPDRLGWDNILSIAKTCVNIDHHRDNGRFGNHNFVDIGAAATGEILADFLHTVYGTLPQTTAEALYTAIMSDTGGFRFSNTNDTVLQACSRLALEGAQPHELYRKIYETKSVNALKLWAQIWNTLSFYFDGKLCVLSLNLPLIEQMGAVYGDTEGAADVTVQALGVEVGIFIKYKDNEAHFSLRSQGRVDVGRMAQKIKGGGGHSCAAGCTMYLPYEEAHATMLELIKEELDTLS